MIFNSKKIIGMIFKEEMETAIEKYEEIQELIKAGKKQDAKAALYTVGSQLSEGRRKRLEVAIGQIKQ